MNLKFVYQHFFGDSIWKLVHPSGEKIPISWGLSDCLEKACKFKLPVHNRAIIVDVLLKEEKGYCCLAKIEGDSNSYLWNGKTMKVCESVFCDLFGRGPETIWVKVIESFYFKEG